MQVLYINNDGGGFEDARTASGRLPDPGQPPAGCTGPAAAGGRPDQYHAYEDRGSDRRVARLNTTGLIVSRSAECPVAALRDLS